MAAVSVVITDRYNKSIQRLEKHMAESTFPPQILGAIKTPKLQFNKNFTAEAGNEWTTTSNTIVTQSRKALLDQLLINKKREMELLKRSSNVDIALTKGLSELTEFYDKMVCHIPSKDRTSNTVALSITNNVQTLRRAYRELLLKAAGLANGDYTRMLVKKVSKTEKKKDNDVEMANATPLDVQSTINSAVKRAVQALSNKKSTKLNPGKSRKGPLKPKTKKVMKPRKKVGKTKTGPSKKAGKGRESGKGKKNVN